MEAMQVLYQEHFDLLKGQSVVVAGYGKECAYMLKKKNLAKREENLPIRNS